MRNSISPLAGGLLTIGLLVAACGGSTGAASPGSGATSSAPGASQASADPGAPSAPPAGGGGGTGNEAIPSLSDGDWTGGQAHAEVTGDVTATVDAPINAGLATTAQDNTTLTYISATAGHTISVALAGGTAAVSVITPEWVGGGGTTVGAQCSITFTTAEDKHLAGTVDCTNAPVLDMGGAANRLATMHVTFSATR